MRCWIWGVPLALLTLSTATPAAPNFSLGVPTPRFGLSAGDQYGVSVAFADLYRDGLAETIVGARDTDPDGIRMRAASLSTPVEPVR